MKKKIYALLLSLSLIAGNIAAPTTLAVAENVGSLDIISNNSSSEEPYFKYENGYTYYVSEGNAEICSYQGTEKSITIPRTIGGYPVTELGYVLQDNEFVEEIIIQDNIACVYSYNFDNAKNLKTIQISAQTHIDGFALNVIGCDSFEEIIVDEEHPDFTTIDGVLFNKDVTRLICYPNAKKSDNYIIPDTVGILGVSPFDGTTNLKNVTIPASLTGISDGGFSNCKNIEGFFVDSNNTAYSSEDGVLFDKNKTKIVEYPSGKTGTYNVPDTVVTIGKYAFENSKLSQIIMHNGITTIEGGAFSNAANLESIEIPSLVTEIYYATFANCDSLEEITIPKNITDIRVNAFGYCDSLINFVVSEENANFTTIDGMICNKEKNKLLCFPSGRTGEFTIPEEIQEVDYETFEGLENLEILNVNKNCTSIQLNIYNCKNLKAINVDKDNTLYASVDGVLYCKYEGELEQLLYCPAKKTGTVTIPASVLCIEYYAFWEARDLDFIVIPSSVLYIGEYDGVDETNAYELWENGRDTILIIEENSVEDKFVKLWSAYGILWHKYCYGHEYEGKVITEPTCTTKGEMLYTCKQDTCKHTYTEEIPAKGHTYKLTTTNATLSSNGSIVNKCTACGDVKSNNVIYSPKTIKLNKTKYTYNGKVRKPSVTVKDSKGKILKIGTDYTVTYAKGRKNTGRYTVTINFKGNYSGTVKKTFDIVPKKVNIRKVTPKKKSFTVTWKKQGKQISGYQIKYSTSKKFTNKTTKTKILSSKKTSFTKNKLKAKKTYYVKLRTYKTIKVNGKKVKLYSAWSSAKKVTTKK